MAEQAGNSAASALGDVKITLHWLNKSRSHRILWLLEELNLPYDLKTYTRGSDMLAPPELKEVHPLGKSPVITIDSPATGGKPIVIAESANIVEYLVEHYAAEKMLPKRYKDGQEGKIGGETEEWLRYRYYMHYSEGSLMNNLTLGLVLNIMKGPQIPFIVRPISRTIATRFEDGFVGPNVKNQWKFLENQLETSSGKFIAGDKLTGADIMLIFPLDGREGYMGLTKENYPKLMAYRDMLVEREAYKRATEKVKEAGGKI